MEKLIKYRRWWSTLLPIGLALLLIAIIATQNRLTIHKEAVTLRMGPGLTYQPLKHQAATEKVRLIGQSHNWYKLLLGDHQVAWAPAWRVNHQTKVAPGNALSEATIVIDAGHGGTDVGAEHVADSKQTKYMEKTYTLQMAQRVAAKLRAQGARVIMTRTDDHFVDLKPRPQVAERVKADAFISFHFDSSPHANEGSGMTTYYYHQGASKTLATLVNHELTPLPLANLGTDFGDFLVIRDNTQPAILCEMGYINTKRDFKQIKSARYQDQAATQIVKGVNRFCQVRAGK